ncbi:maleylpyruvate isomerase family mycothiol-dependent enzyme [Nocardioides daeguensis]|uniref:Maleylpyruvate isomerase family mycothiol-dependent enzyme n=1 Tax=Nocardioides daeguensis TaxID=908359 RepID=A0ABP6W2L1_9ACTN|nr:maleylpyruvate isomerase family mycothiol-dependent enzyme [Nocardioides daeguensis]MBV6726733.1 maleylpyruvate isomerase family mycothiol-dependent enzyme [Nocardioides daeguensis]MCR1774515.1 maleylpyruvate isomerase family mycothiol-dependent enzyme [Nocardioides daeguensis]
MTSPTAALAAATDRVLATARALPAADWTGPSLCAGWTRAHVLAHLALNAESLAGVLRGIREGAPVTMYSSDRARGQDITELATAAPQVVLERLVSGCAALTEVIDVAAGLAPGSTFERTPGGRLMPADAVPHLRLREVEIHHADLDAGYGPADWPPTTAMAFLHDDAARYDGPGFHVVATDEPARWAFGSPAADAATVSGPLGALAWWATGREAAPVVSSTTGTLPRLEGR